MAIVFIWLSAVPIFLITLYVGFNFGDEALKLFVNIYECTLPEKSIAVPDGQINISPYEALDVSTCVITPPLYLVTVMNVLPVLMDGLMAAGIIVIGIVLIFPRLRK